MSNAISYRPEIDGLRAISVIFVILHHLGWSLVPGGYVGVDVFFVISGYLITKIVATEICNRNFSIQNFYKRRIIRLAPAYFLMLAVTSIASLVIMLPSELLNYIESVVYSTFFSANFYMWKEVGGYFGNRSEFVPLLHLWSLAVEEQFYIFWPLALLLILKFVRSNLILVVAFAALVVVTIAISEWGVQHFRAAAYYLMPTRAFELLIGALLVFLPERNWTKLTRNTMTITGLSLIFFAGLTYSKDKFFPGINAIIPCTGTALLLFFCKAKTDICGYILATPLLNFIGKISYPAYLWHWPIIVFLNIYMIEIDLLIGVLTILGTMMLSSLTYFYVEIPAKKTNRFPFSKVFTAGFIIPTVFFLLMASLVFSSKGWPQRFPDSLNIKSEALQSFSQKSRGRCNEGNIQNPSSEDQCILGVTDRPVDFLLIGDSHANHFTGMLDTMAKDARVRGYDMTQSSTIFLPDTKSYYMVDGKRIEYSNFELRVNKWKKLIESKKYKAIVLGGSFASHYNEGDFSSEYAQSPQEVFETQMTKAVEFIINSGSTAYIIKGTPRLDGVEYDCALQNERFDAGKICDLSLDKHQNNFKKWDMLLANIVKQYPQVIVIDPTKIMCDTKVCFSTMNDIPLYRDAGHLNDIGSKFVGQLYVAKYGNPLLAIKHAKKVE